MSNLTFGVEIECLLICPRSDCNTMAAQGRCEGIPEFAPQHMVHEALSKPFIAPCHRKECNQHHTYTLPMLPRANSEVPGVYDTWQASTDFTVRLEPEDTIDRSKYVVGQIEIKSRILNAAKLTPCCVHHELDTCYSGDKEWPWQWELAQVVNILRTEFNNPQRPGYRLKVNSTTGLHVHVGGVETHLWPKVARGVTGLFTACERQLDTLLPDYRIGWYDGNAYGLPATRLPSMIKHDDLINPRTAQYCRPMSDTHIHNMTNPKIVRTGPENGPLIYFKGSKDYILPEAMEGLHVPAWLYSIYSARNIDELQQWIHKRSASVNLINLVTDPEFITGKKQTIEFRNHAGSIDFAEISAWVDLTVSTVRWAQETDSVEAIQDMLHQWSDNNDRMISLAYLVDTSIETQNHYVRRYPKANTQGSAVQRFEAAMELENAYDTTQDDLGALSRSIETRRMNACLKPVIAAKIQTKFCNGFYGKFPQTMLTRYVRRKFNDDLLMQCNSTQMALNDKDKAPVISMGHENPVAGWRRALITLAGEREAEAQPPRSRPLTSSSSSSTDSTSCCGLPIYVAPLRRVSLVFENMF